MQAEIIDIDADDSGVTVQEPTNSEKQSVFIDLTLDDEPSDDGSRAGLATHPAERAPLKRAGSSASQAAPPTKRRKEQAMESVASPAHKPSSKRPHSNAPHELSDKRDLDYSDEEPPIKRSRRQGCHVEVNRFTLERTSSSRVKDVVMIEYDVSTEDEEENSSSVVADYASADDASDSEREYETLYDALNPKIEKNWLPPKPHLSPRPLRKRDEDLLALNLAAMTVSPSSDDLVKERKKQDKGQVHGFRLPPDLLSLERGRNAYRGNSFVWTEASDCVVWPLI
ncbi:uncharacterized protein LAESUDRAFT_759056 [Laetiporus sulphureus 93-53]|uniref:Uncharacterized protein n=1 Tax=Laetiporus sulphureus 93-53 TaxID=1314785 RepID=A0A165EEL5_9APHY|nr:uncharacterized protein LAESUDRAFT_759056 [Laetiporus sulphureus 93-53]KZT06888.1 hypothetical protein LAESUDRAFT_759056 [Laetiporus sulphureus 93-53]